MKKATTLTLVMAVLVSLAVAFCPAFAEPPLRGGPKVKAHQVKTKIIKPPQIPVDLSIYAVGNKGFSGECSPCSDQLARVGVFYLNDLTVGVQCNTSSTNVREVSGTVKVAYTSAFGSRRVTRTKQFRVPCQGVPRHVRVTLESSPLLIKRDGGIVAEVIPDPLFKDTDLSNNKLTETDPTKMCVGGIVY